MHGRNWAVVLRIVATAARPSMRCAATPCTVAVVGGVTAYGPVEVDAVDGCGSARGIAVNEGTSAVIHIVSTIALSISRLSKVVIHAVPSKGPSETVG